MAASLGENLILNMGGSHTCVDIQLCRALDIEDVPVATVHVCDHWWNVQMFRRNPFFRVPDGHSQLKFSQRTDRAPGRVRYFDAGIHVHVCGSEMPYRE